MLPEQVHLFEVNMNLFPFYNHKLKFNMNGDWFSNKHFVHNMRYFTVYKMFSDLYFGTRKNNGLH